MTWIAYFLLYPVSLISRPQSTSLCAENKGRKLATLACYIYGSWSDPPLIFTGLENIIYHDSLKCQKGQMVNMGGPKAHSSGLKAHRGGLKAH